MSGADIPAGSSDPPSAVRTFSRGADDAGDAGSTGSGDRHDDQLERQCGECCVPLDELDGNDTSASDAEDGSPSTLNGSSWTCSRPKRTPSEMTWPGEVRRDPEAEGAAGAGQAGR